MSRNNKAWVVKVLREANCIDTPILNQYFKSVWVGEELKQLLKTANRKTKK